MDERQGNPLSGMVRPYDSKCHYITAWTLPPPAIWCKMRHNSPGSAPCYPPITAWLFGLGLTRQSARTDVNRGADVPVQFDPDHPVHFNRFWLRRMAVLLVAALLH
jgi:hypothetical protein